jgi:hypothetical protein
METGPITRAHAQKNAPTLLNLQATSFTSTT